MDPAAQKVHTVEDVAPVEKKQIPFAYMQGTSKAALASGSALSMLPGTSTQKTHTQGKNLI